MISDVTTWNPNILYELGLRHASRKGGTILLKNSDTTLPFDLNICPTLTYRLTYTGKATDIGSSEFKLDGDAAESLRPKLVEAIKAELGGESTLSPLHVCFPELHVDLPREPCVFIGHGRSKLWARVQLFLEKELGLTTTNYESESRVGESFVPILEKMLNQATFAVLILTGEDETQGAQKRARQNVIHEAGLFQGVLGFNRAVVLKQDNLEDFSNIAGLQFISFDGENIEKTFWELQKVLKREKLIA
jgi:CAP12/Pycsar effector protein, TIR domain